MQDRVAPANGYHVHFDGEVFFSAHVDCVPRTFDVDILGKLADEVAAYPERLIDIALRVWMHEEGEDEASCGIVPDSKPEVTITVNADDSALKAAKQRMSGMPFLKRKEVTA